MQENELSLSLIINRNNQYYSITAQVYTFPINMSLCASTGPVLGPEQDRYWQLMACLQAIIHQFCLHACRNTIYVDFINNHDNPFAIISTRAGENQASNISDECMKRMTRQLEKNSKKQRQLSYPP